jgi:hypothetical protein
MSIQHHDDSRLHDGLHYPIDHLIGVLPTADEAEQAIQSLYNAGYTDVEVLEGLASEEILESSERATNPLTRAWRRLSLYLSDEDDAARAAANALHHGHAIVMVHASSKAQQDQAEIILRAHGAYWQTYFGRWTITEVNQ